MREIIYIKLSDKYEHKLEKIGNTVDDTVDDTVNDKIIKRFLEDIQLNTDKLSSLET